MTWLCLTYKSLCALFSILFSFGYPMHLTWKWRPQFFGQVHVSHFEENGRHFHDVVLLFNFPDGMVTFALRLLYFIRIFPSRSFYFRVTIYGPRRWWLQAQITWYCHRRPISSISRCIDNRPTASELTRCNLSYRVCNR